MTEQKTKGKDNTRLILLVILGVVVVILALTVSNNYLLQGMIMNIFGVAPNADGGGGWRWLS